MPKVSDRSDVGYQRVVGELKRWAKSTHGRQHEETMATTSATESSCIPPEFQGKDDDNGAVTKLF